MLVFRVRYQHLCYVITKVHLRVAVLEASLHQSVLHCGLLRTEAKQHHWHWLHIFHCEALHRIQSCNLTTVLMIDAMFTTKFNKCSSKQMVQHTSDVYVSNLQSSS